jgi:trans-2,3-dihydro-3-hydroxyanthranilate isomerase
LQLLCSFFLLLNLAVDIGHPALDSESLEKTKPTRFVLGGSENNIASYPRQGRHMRQQQHVTLALEEKSITQHRSPPEAVSTAGDAVGSCSLPPAISKICKSRGFLHRRASGRINALCGFRKIESCHGGQTMGSAGRRLAMAQWDVFSARPLEGNSLAVFFDGRGLTDAEMLSIAKEMNLSETTFILPRDAAAEAERGVRVRIFTVQEELPFAGHPTLGTAFALHAQSGKEEVVLELNVGRVPVRFENRKAEPPFGEMTQIDPTFGMRHDRDAVAQLTGLRPQDIDDSLPIQTVSTGVPFTIVPLKSLALMQNIAVDFNGAAQYLAKTEGKFFYFVTRETIERQSRLHARMLFYNGEDPATGSAAGCTSAWMVAHGVAKPDEPVLIEQGIEMKRPSRIFVRASRIDNRIVNVRVGGNSVEIMRGELFF